MGYGLGGFFGDMAESGLRTYNTLENNKRAKAQDKRAAESHEVEMTKARREEALRQQLMDAGADNFVFDGPDLPMQGGSTTRDFADQFSPQAMQGFGQVPTTQAQPPQVAQPTTPPTPQALPSVAPNASFAQAFSPQVMQGIQQAETPAPAPAALPQATQPAPLPPEMVTVRDPFTRQHHQVPKAQVREKSIVERARDIAAVYMANGQPDKAMDVVNKSLETALNQKNFDKREVADTLARSRANPEEFAAALTAANKKAGVNIQVDVEMVRGQPVLRFNQTGSASPPFYTTPTGELSTQPIPGSYGVQSAALVAGVLRDPMEVYRDVVSAQASVQGMVLARNQDARATNADAREQGLYGLRREGMALENQGRAISNEGGTISNQGGRISNEAASAEFQESYGLPPSGRIGPTIEDAALRAAPGAVVTSRQRSAAKNKSVGGVEDSFHKTDDARDFVPPKGVSMKDLHAQLRQAFPTSQFDVINEGDHVHVEPTGRLAQEVRGGKAFQKQQAAWQEKFTSWVDKNAAPDGSDAMLLRESYLKIHPEAAPYLVTKRVAASELGGGAPTPAPSPKPTPKPQARAAIPAGPSSVASSSPYYAAIPSLFPKQEPGRALVGKERDQAWAQSRPAGGLLIRGR